MQWSDVIGGSVRAAWCLRPTAYFMWKMAQSTALPHNPSKLLHGGLLVRGNPLTLVLLELLHGSTDTTCTKTFY